ncbi:alpha/beta hydrolase family protein [Alteromonas sp. CYL-A6]|uniref:alpha/beta hydrolase family protein n=1 Tax=Alteromonas nitratireducens TaxID=3390813 RepID=UPI0034BB075F
MTKRLGYLCLLMWLIVPQASAATLSNVSYSSVTGLPVTPATTVFSYGDDPLQVIRYWAPAAAEQTGSVVFIHGGCWLSAYDIAHSEGFLSALAQRGFAVYGIEYRRTGNEGGGWPGSLNDIKTALQVLTGQHLVSSSPSFLLGHSAGGHLALLAAREFDAEFTRVIGLAAITDINAYARGSNSCQTATPRFMGGEPDERQHAYQQANPRQYTMPDQVLLMQGSSDGIVPVSQSQWPGVERELVEDAGHFDWLHPSSQAFARLMNHLLRKE